MKVFQVTTERCDPDSKQIIETIQYVTSEDNSLCTVVEFFTKECEEFESDLKGVREVLVISQRIKPE